MKQSSQLGFSLVELSIVLVILGLLTGGILGGQSLMRAAELRAVLEEYKTYQIAVNTFQNQYLALPGDMNNAEAFWGEADSDPATCKDTVSTGTETCDGDGNGHVDNESAASYESARFWQHLTNAGLLEGSFTGVSDLTNGNGCTIGENCPTSKFSGATWRMNYHGEKLADAQWYDASAGHHFNFGKPNSVSFNPEAGIIKPEEAWNIDTKIDDGRPAYGKIMVFKQGATAWAAEAANCTDSATSSDAEYNFSSTDNECPLVFIAD